MTPTEKKEAYKAKCRTKELARCEALGITMYTQSKPTRAKHKEARPVYGSQQWAETYRDDLGESFD